MSLSSIGSALYVIPNSQWEHGPQYWLANVLIKSLQEDEQLCRLVSSSKSLQTVKRTSCLNQATIWLLTDQWRLLLWKTTPVKTFGIFLMACWMYQTRNIWVHMCAKCVHIENCEPWKYSVLSAHSQQATSWLANVLLATTAHFNHASTLSCAFVMCDK